MDTCLFWGHWYPCFGFLLISLGFKAELPYSLFCGGECNVHSLRSTSDAICANLLAASSAASHFPTCVRFEQAITHTENECATIVPATRLLPFSEFINPSTGNQRTNGLFMNTVFVPFTKRFWIHWFDFIWNKTMKTIFWKTHISLPLYLW